jgi:hypothetical protein
MAKERGDHHAVLPMFQKPIDDVKRCEAGSPRP